MGETRISSQLQRLTPVRAYFKWLTRQNVLLWNPASEIELPRQEKRLPKHVLTIDDAERVMDVPDVGDAIGLRDRAILETLYSTGIRRMEVMNLLVYDLDAERGTLIVRQGKGKKDRKLSCFDDQRSKEYTRVTMQPLKAVVKNGRLLVDEPTALPEGTEIELLPVGDDFDPEERARLLAALDDGIEDFERGDHMEGFDFIAQMRAKREAAGR